MKYYEDLKEKAASGKLADFVLSVINDYKTSDLYNEAYVAYEYFKKRNITINQCNKMLYKVTGEAVPDLISPNHKLPNAFFPIFVKQENAFCLGNGVTFNNSDTKEKLGGDEFDGVIYDAGESSLWGAISYLFFNFDHVEYFHALEFAPLFGMEDGALHAGVRFWQIDVLKPLRATLFEEDGFTEFIWRDGEAEVLQPKTSYKLLKVGSKITGYEIYNGSNYPTFPIVPLWGNREHQSELTGLREKIDGYDLIQSNFANDLDESQLFWIINNAGGMDEIDLQKFIDSIRRAKAAIVEDDGATAEAHTLNIPYEARRIGLQEIRDSLYRDAMALDTEKITAGNITATAINAAYENLELKADGYEYCLIKAIKSLLKIIDIDDSPIFHRRKTTNQSEVAQMVLSAAQYLDDETILKHLPFIQIDEIDEILKQKDKEESDRFAGVKEAEDEEDETGDA